MVNPGEWPTGTEGWTGVDPLWEEFDALERRRLLRMQLAIMAACCASVTLSALLVLWIHAMWEQGLESLVRLG